MTKEALAVQEEQSTAVGAALDPTMFAQDSGMGMEGTDINSFAIPFLAILQKMSPQVDEADPAYIAGAKAGMLLNTVSGQLYDGKDGIEIIPCAYRRTFLRWGARQGDSSGFKGEYTPEQASKLVDDGLVVEQDGKLFFPLDGGIINDKKCDILTDTRLHYVLIADPATGATTQALLSLSSTQIKKSKQLMTLLNQVKITNADRTFNPPTFANRVLIQSVVESNDKGAWHGVKFELKGFVESADTYAEAKVFHGAIHAGDVKTNFEASPQTGSGFTEEADGKF